MSFNTPAMRPLRRRRSAYRSSRPRPPARGTLQPGATAQPRRSPRALRGGRAGRRSALDDATYRDLGRLFAEFLERGRELDGPACAPTPHRWSSPAPHSGCPGAERLFDDANVARLLDGEQGIDVIPAALRREMLDKHITRLVKGDDGTARFETIDSADDVIKLAARAGDSTSARSSVSTPTACGARTRDAAGHRAGIDAMRDAGIPLVQHYRTTTKAPSCRPLGAARRAARRHRRDLRLRLPRPRRDDRRGHAPHRSTACTASGWPRWRSVRDRMLDHGDPARRSRSRPPHPRPRPPSRQEPYAFDRRFLFRVLSMGHSQFAELIGARGPNTQVNAACASTTQAIAIAEDWIRPAAAGASCRRRRRRRPPTRCSPWIGAGLPGLGRGGHRRRRRGRRAAVRPAPPRDDPRHGRGRHRGRERRRRARARHRSRSARCSARSPRTARSTARGSTSSTSAG